MTTARIERWEVLECVERYGLITRLVRQARVIGIPDNDYKALLTALAESSVPQPGTTCPGAPNLILTERTSKAVEKGVVDVTVTYEHAFNEAQDIDSPRFGLVLAECQVSLSQVATNKDEDGNTVTVEHTYPADDPDYPNMLKVQGGEFQKYQAQPTLRIQGVKFTSTPWLIQRMMVGSVNGTEWGGGETGTWMCQACTWKPMDLGSSPIRFFMTFEFQYNPDGWNPTVIFKDDRTGAPPPGLVNEVGYKTVKVHPEINFNIALGARVQGG